VRRIEFVTELPKTLSGKIRRVDLRKLEADRRQRGLRDEGEILRRGLSGIEGRLKLLLRGPLAPGCGPT